MGLRLGIDTGGTYTDAVIVDADTQSVIAKSKSLTTRHNLIEGVAASIGKTLGDRRPEDVNLVCLSTTLATNAIVEGHGARAALVLMGYRQSQLFDEATRDMPVIMVDGAHDAAGHEVSPLDVDAVVRQISALGSSIASVLPVTCGHELSASLDAPRRALTAFINARLIPLIKDLIVATRNTMADHGISAPLMVVRGDGTLVSSDFAEHSPVETAVSSRQAEYAGV